MNRTKHLYALLTIGILALPLAASSQALINIPDGPNVASPTDPLNEDHAKFSVSTLPETVGAAEVSIAGNCEGAIAPVSLLIESH